MISSTNPVTIVYTSTVVYNKKNYFTQNLTSNEIYILIYVTAIVMIIFTFDL